MRVALRRHALTGELAGGASPLGSPELTLLAGRLIGLRRRRQLAHSLRGLIRDAHQRQLRRAPIIHRRAVLEAEDAISGLVARLGDNGPVAVEGIAMLEWLLTNGGSSPLYNAAGPGTLRRQVLVVTAAMDPELADLPSTV